MALPAHVQLRSLRGGFPSAPARGGLWCRCMGPAARSWSTASRTRAGQVSQANGWTLSLIHI
eukprot:3634527-Rhodomonas_salina.1